MQLLTVGVLAELMTRTYFEAGKQKSCVVRNAWQAKKANGSPRRARLISPANQSTDVANSIPINPPPWLWLVLLVFWAFYMNLGGWPLFDVDEGVSGATTEMLVNGNYVSTFIAGAPRVKPILIYWLQGLSVTLFGHNEGVSPAFSVAATLWVWDLCLR